MLLVPNIPLVGLWARAWLSPAPICFASSRFSLVGSCSIGSSFVDSVVMMFMSLIGDPIRKLQYPIAPVALTIVLGPPFEMSLRQSRGMSGGHIAILTRSALSTSLLAMAALVIVLSAGAILKFEAVAL